MKLLKSFKVYDLEELLPVAEYVAKLTQKHTIFALYGELGSGKTTFVQAICYQFEVLEDVVSPTFSIINEYTTKTGQALYHFDFYRIDNPEEAYDIGYEDYFFSNKCCFVEWPEKIEELIPENHISIEIKVVEQNARVIDIYEV